MVPDRDGAVHGAHLYIRAAVADLLAAYQYHADCGHMDEVLALFRPDARFETNSIAFEGTDQIRAHFVSIGRTLQKSDSLPVRHHLGSVYIQPRNSSVTAYASFQMFSARGLDNWGFYRDEIVYADGRWQFTRRRAVIEGYAPGSPLRALIGPARDPEARATRVR